MTIRGALLAAPTTMLRLPVTGVATLFAVVTLRLSTSGEMAPVPGVPPVVLAFTYPASGV